ncbi:hypothetical protein LZ30DRAFT_187991 [Colletotrichum cereale]|nr:hypothetical protein LZ30DRAFT_187991 [Colletotrichum cereale]
MDEGQRSSLYAIGKPSTKLRGTDAHPPSSPSNYHGVCCIETQDLDATQTRNIELVGTASGGGGAMRRRAHQLQEMFLAALQSTAILGSKAYDGSTSLSTAPQLDWRVSWGSSTRQLRIPGPFLEHTHSALGASCGTTIPSQAENRLVVS